MSDIEIGGAKTRPSVVLRQFLDKLDRVKRRKSFSEGQTPDSVAARLRRYLSDRAQQQPTGS
jgi:hypothetical protein